MPLSESLHAAAAQATDLPAKTIGRADRHIWGIYISLLIISVIELYSASSREVASSAMGVFGPLVRHTIMLAAGFVIILGLQRVHYRHFYGWAALFVIASVAAAVYCMFFGEIINGARRSFSFLGFSIQPSELLKLSSVLILAIVAQRNQMKGGGVTNTGVAIMAGVVMLFGGLLIQQGLTNTLLLMSISMAMFLIGGVQWKKIWIVLGVYIVCFGVFYVATHSGDDDEAEPRTEQTTSAHADDIAASTAGERGGTWGHRLQRWLDPTPKYERKIDAKNRQEMYAYMAQANGGIFGVFPGNSRETARLPLAFSDYIFSIIVEDLGLVGGVLVLLLYLWLMARASGIAARCNRAFPAFLVLGLAVMIVMQALFHIAIVTGVFPVSGQPLPLISKGGSSILVTSIAFGIMLSVSRFAGRSGSKTDREVTLAENISLPDDMQTDNPTQLR